MLSSPLQYFFDKYEASSINSWVRWPYFRYIRSQLAVKWHFGMKVLPTELNFVYFALSTVLLKRVLKDKLRNSPELKLLEIGVGAYAVLSGCLSRWNTQTIDAVDIDMKCVENAKKTIEFNRVNVNVFYSDLFSNVPTCKYNLIFWNMPYNESDPNTYLPGLFTAAPDFMSDNAQLIICYKTKPSRTTVLNILSNYDRYDRLHVAEIKTWWWNPIEVLLIGKNQ